MEKFNCLVDSSFNLLNASEKSQSKLEDTIKSLEHNSEVLNKTSKNIETKVSSAVSDSSRKAAEYISESVISKLTKAEESANIAAARYEKAAKYSVLKIGLMFFVFFLSVIALLAFIFIKNLPTINELTQLEEKRNALKLEINQYGNLLYCDDKPCVAVDTSSGNYSRNGQRYYIIIPKN
jgi:hypothetical protein